MPAIVDDAVVLRVWEFSETSQTAALFTRAHGSVRALAKGSRRPKAPFSGGLDLLTRGEAVYYARAGSDLVTLAEWDLREVFWSARRRLDSHAVALHVIDLCARFIQDHDPHPALHDALLAALRSIEAGEDHALALLRFQWALLRETGYLPEVRRDVVTGGALGPGKTYAFDSHRGGLTRDAGAAAAPGPTWRVRAETVETLRWLDEPDNLPAGPERESVRRAVRLLSEHVSTVLGRPPETLAGALGAL